MDFDASFSDLIGASSLEELTEALSITFDENPLFVPVFESMGNMGEVAGTAALLEDLAGLTPQDAFKMALEYGEVPVQKVAPKPLPAIVKSRHQQYVTGLVDSMRHLPVFRPIRNSEIWDSLVQSCVDYVEGQVADVAR